MWIVRFAEPALASYTGTQIKRGSKALAATSPAVTGARRLDMSSNAVQAYRQELADRREARLEAAAAQIGRPLEPAFVYDAVLNGVALELSAEEAAMVAELPGVAGVERERIEQLQDDVSTALIGAPDVWTGAAGVASRGEGVVVGVVDSGINPTHPSFAAVSPVDGYVHANPKGSFLGLCATAAATCNNKLIGIWDFSTGSGETEPNNGVDLDGHGTHVAGTAVGNAVNIVRSFSDGAQLSYQIRGVAPRANLITYKACEDDGCAGSWTLAALNQAVLDGVDVINYSIGGSNVSPWSSSGSLAMLDARNAGIVVAVAAGNSGPDVGTVRSPSDSPWVLSVANTTHGRRYVNRLRLSGGGTAPPNGGLMVGQGLTGGVGPAPLVRDPSHPLCSQGSGDQSLPVTGASNPWPANRWSGQLVVCDRGVQARVAKSNNVRLSGGAGTVLLNTAAEGESTVADEHSIPTTHLGWADAQSLLQWLGNGSGHAARIDGVEVETLAANADVLSTGSARGPSPVLPGVIKPDLAAPGSSILSASHQGNGDASLSGTSMASPHVAGAAALLRGAKPSWRADQIISALMGTARTTVARRVGGTAVPANEQGAGRIDVARAVRAPLAFVVPAGQFAAGSGAQASLNLPSMVFDGCSPVCSTLTRTVTDLIGGASYRATFTLPAGVTLTTPETDFSVGPGASKALPFSARIDDPSLYGRWLYGSVRIARVGGSADEALTLPVALRAPVAGLPGAQTRNVDSDRGFFDLVVPGLNLGSPNARFAGTRLVGLTTTRYTLTADPTPSDRYDNLSNGVGWHAISVPAPANGERTRVRIEVELQVPGGTQTSLIVGNGGGPGSRNQICESATRCVLDVEHYGDPGAQAYWAMVWNRSGSGEFVVRHSVLPLTAATTSENARLTATGPGNATAGQSSAVRVGWNDPTWAVGEVRRGAVLVSAAPGQQPMGAIPYTLTRIAGPRAALSMAHARAETVGLAAGEAHDAMFIDVPTGATQLTVTTASSANIDVYLAWRPPNSGPGVPSIPVAPARGEASHVGNGTTGNESVTVSSPAAGRWYVTPVNASGAAATTAVTASITAAPPTVRPGGYFNADRAGHGVFVYPAGPDWAALWYTYLEDGSSTWYYLQGPRPGANGVWRGTMFRSAWNGSANSLTAVGEATATPTGPDAFTWTWKLDGQTGSEPLSAFGRGCPTIGGQQVDASGHWFDPASAGSGYSVQLFPNYEFYTVFGYDARGVARYLLAERSGAGAPAETLPLGQNAGFCPLCARSGNPTRTQVGTIERRFANGALSGFTLNASYVGGVPGTWAANDSVSSLGERQGCAP
ncbi:S8 family serine peptidase [Silanimonas sp.]|uniref:S8 family serine peptidase n=1 Tax=Silanimonas sp. TaxID=1929290 RepID=UPI0026052ABA|nr:S8 family serine peptidase [Silanimonas sp.]